MNFLKVMNYIRYTSDKEKLFNMKVSAKKYVHCKENKPGTKWNGTKKNLPKGYLKFNLYK